MSDITKQVGSLQAAKGILKRNPITDDMRKRDRITADRAREQREYMKMP